MTLGFVVEFFVGVFVVVVAYFVASVGLEDF